MKNQTISIDIPARTIWKVFGLVGLVLFLWATRDVFLLLFLAIVVVSAAQPIVAKLENRRIPRTPAVLILYLGFLVLFFGVFYLLLPLVLSELKQFIEVIPRYVKTLDDFLKNLNNLAASYNFKSDFEELIRNATGRLLSSISNLFSNALAVLLGFLKALFVISVSFYMLVRKNGTEEFLRAVLPAKHHSYAIDLVSRIQKKMGRWMIGQFSMMAIIFLLEYIALLILDVPFALTLALIGGLLEIVPYIGPFISIFLAFLVGLSISPVVAFGVGFLFVLIQQIENYFIGPLVMKKAVGLNPVVIITALAIGGKLAGVLGLIIAVPLATALGIFVRDLMDKKQGTVSVFEPAKVPKQPSSSN